MTKIKIFYEPAVSISGMNNGGANRTNQIHNFLKNNFDLIYPKENKFTFKPRLIRYMQGFLFLIKSNTPVKSLFQVSQTGYFYSNIKEIIKNNPEAKYLFWESSINDQLIRPKIYYHLNIKLFCFPHNIESLVPKQKSPITKKISPNWLDEELALYQLCQHVFAISLEENWFFNLNNIRSTYYPFFPDKEFLADLKKIRVERAQNAIKDYYLVLGSFSYDPIKHGILELIDFLINNNPNCKIKIAGFFTEEILKIYKNLPEYLEVVGSVSKQKLIELYTECKGIIINQLPSSGALTKITEMKIAGIPVISNVMSLRTHYNSKGCIFYNNLNEMLEIISNNTCEIPNYEINITKYEKEALNQILKFLS